VTLRMLHEKYFPNKCTRMASEAKIKEGAVQRRSNANFERGHVYEER